MTARRDQFKQRDALEMLGASSAAPDLTGRVMGRLGFTRAVESAVRRRQRQQRLTRLACVAAMALAAGAGWHVHRTSQAVRTPHEVTVPGAIIHDVQQRQMQFRTLFEHMRPQPPVQPTEPLPVESSNEPNWPSDDVNRSAGAAVQWV